MTDRTTASALTGLLLALCLGSLATLLGGCSFGPWSTTAQGTLVFEVEEGDNTEVYRMELDGKGRVNLTNHPAWDGTPCWSPDGTQIAFSSDREGTPDLYVMKADGSDLRRLTDWDAAEVMPAWSPDGTQIALATDRVYREQRQGGTATIESGLEIWVLNLDGTDPTRITGDPQDVAIYPTWSRDGRQIAYQNVSSHSDIVAMTLLGRIPRNLTEGSEKMNWSPAWSPEEGIILFTGDDGENKDIYLMDQTGGNVRNLTNHSAADADPGWSPDGKWVVFVSDREGVPQIFVMDKEGQNLRQITEGNAAHARPAWRPTAGH